MQEDEGVLRAAPGHADARRNLRRLLARTGTWLRPVPANASVDSGPWCALPDGSRICPVSGILNNVLCQMLTAQVCDEMCHRGAIPIWLYGVNWVGGIEYNEVTRLAFEERGY